MKRSQAWINRHVNDPYVQRAQQDGYVSRAAYKLLEIQDRCEVLCRGQYVVDLGAAPGGWSQVALQAVGDCGLVVGVDLLPVSHVSGGVFIQGDFLQHETISQIEAALRGKQADVVLSDMAPNMSGNPSIDQPRAMWLLENAWHFCQSCLKTGGFLVCKVFHGSGLDAFRQQIIQEAKLVKTIKPRASRSTSRETYWVIEKV